MLVDQSESEIEVTVGVDQSVAPAVHLALKKMSPGYEYVVFFLGFMHGNGVF